MWEVIVCGRLVFVGRLVCLSPSSDEFKPNMINDSMMIEVHNWEVCCTS